MLTIVGRSTAYARIAHLLYEMWCQLDAVGLIDSRSYELPMTKSEIGDAMGLSTVHQRFRTCAPTV
jgi:hypothetical protein